MKLIIDIADELQEFSSEADSVIIGAGPDCDIVLEYENIGLKHLQVFLESGQVYIQDLSSGYPTFVESNQIPAGSKLVFKLGSPAEVGGIYIHNQTPASFEEFEEFEEESSLDDLSKTLFSEDSDVSEPAVAENKEKFKPNLFDGTEFSSEASTSIEEPLESIISKQIRASSKAATNPNLGQLKQKRRNSRNSSGKTKSQAKTSLFTPKLILVFIVLVGAMGYNYWFEIHVPAQERLAQLREKQKYSVKIIQGNVSKSLKNFTDFYFQNKPCSFEETKSLCLSMSKYFNPQSVFDGVGRYSNSLILAINNENIPKLLDSMIPKDVNEDFLRNEVENRFIDKFDYDYFVKSKMKAPYKSFEYERNDNADLMLFAWMMLNEEFKELDKFDEVVLVSYIKDVSDIKILNTLRVKSDILKIKKTLMEYNVNRLKSMWNHYLLNDPRNYFSSFGDLYDRDFSKKELQREIGLKRNEGYLSRVSLTKCQTELTLKICNAIKQVRTMGKAEGALLVEDRLFLYLNLENINTRYSNLYINDYNNDEKRELIRLFGSQSDGSQTTTDFQVNNYIMNVDKVVNFTNSLLSDFIDSSYYDLVKDNLSINSIALIGITESSLIENDLPVVNFSMEFDKKNLESFDRAGALSIYKYFWISRVNIFQSITSRVSNFTVFEEKK